jgi:hypothetical protein
MKKVVIISAILLCSLAITSVVFAEQQLKETCALGWGNECIIPKPKTPILSIQPQPKYDVQMANGVAVDRYYLTTEPVLFVIFNYDWNSKMYLIVNGEFYKMEQIESRYDWNTYTRMFKYRDDYGDVMVLTAQEFQGGISISAIYKNYIITFEPIGYEVHTVEPVVRQTQVMPLMPVFSQLTQGMAQSMGGMKTGVSAETLISQAKPIADWSQKGK